MQIHNPLEQFLVLPIFKFSVFNRQICVTNLMLFLMISTTIFTGIMILCTKNLAIRPNKKQAFIETLYQMAYSMVANTMGIKKGKKFIPLIFCIFLFILICNLVGMLPYSFACTSHITVTLSLAAIVFIVIVTTGTILHGYKFLKIFAPSGCPIWLLPLMIVIELFSFLSRPISIALRLAANITSGHILLHIIMGFVTSLWLIAKALPFGFAIVIVMFELGVCVLQAYIFAILSCVYINDVLELH